MPLARLSLASLALAAAAALSLTGAPAMAQDDPNLAYLAQNAKEEGVTTTESGLQIKTLTEGTGRSPAASDTVLAHYTGTLVDGTEFDSSRRRGEPIAFPLNRVIPGWTEGLQLMKEGGRAELTIPASLGYGARGVPGAIPPNATLIFDVELLEVR